MTEPSPRVFLWESTPNTRHWNSRYPLPQPFVPSLLHSKVRFRVPSRKPTRSSLDLTLSTSTSSRRRTGFHSLDQKCKDVDRQWRIPVGPPRSEGREDQGHLCPVHRDHRLLLRTSFHVDVPTLVSWGCDPLPSFSASFSPARRPTQSLLRPMCRSEVSAQEISFVTKDRTTDRETKKERKDTL